MLLTKEVFSEINVGEIFKVVTTRIQRFHEPFKMKLKFICIKGIEPGINDWAVYVGLPEQSDDYIAHHGDKVTARDIIRSMCPCDDEVFQLYRY